MGVPVVTMNNGGMAELIKDGVTGVLADEPTPEGLSMSLRRALENGEYTDSLRENCKNERKNILSVEEYAEILVKEYERLVTR